jgi:hypothetical protein
MGKNMKLELRKDMFLNGLYLNVIFETNTCSIFLVGYFFVKSLEEKYPSITTGSPYLCRRHPLLRRFWSRFRGGWKKILVTATNLGKTCRWLSGAR